MYATNHCETQVLNTLRGITCIAPLQLFVGLYLSNPTDTGTAGVEITYTGYARQPVTFSMPAAEAGINGLVIRNTADIVFPQSPIDAGTVQFVGLSDSLIGGNMWLFGTLSESLVVNALNQPSISQSLLMYWMTGASSAAFKARVLNIFRAQNLQGVTPFHSLWTGDPDAGGFELLGDNYMRQAVTFGAPVEQPSGQSQISNTSEVLYPAPTAIWGNWSFSALMDSASGGSVLYRYERPAPEIIRKNYQPFIPAGEFKVALN